MAASQETLRRLVVELRLLEGTANTLQSRLNFVNAIITELNYAKNTLDGLENENKDVPLLVPIGGGSHIKAKLASAEKVIVGIGASVALEKPLNEAQETIGTRIEQLEKTRGSLQQQLTQVAQKIGEDQTRLQELSGNLRTESPRNVQQA